MSHLLAISVGPVQEFIAAARRTRDLWFGSYLLSEISKALAKCVRDNHGGTLIFPHPDTNLEPDQPEINVANVILAELATGEPKNVAATAKRAAQKRWRDFANEAQSAASGEICSEIWEDQIDDVIEFFAAWVMRSTDYQEDRAKVMRLLAGRKLCRDFLPAKGRAGVRKSSLDGQRESVLKPPTEWRQRFRTRLRIREGEQLDVVGLVKRVAGGNQPYPSVARIAADPWVRGNQHELTPITAACEQLGVQVIRPLNTSAYPQFSAFPYEGTSVYTSRHHELIEETETTTDKLRPLREALARMPQPEPYLAILVADGDKMGAAIRELKTVKENQEFSQTLARFAGQARKIVNHNNGVLVFAGGDDVLAFVPVDKCLACTRELRNKFVEMLKGYKNDTSESPTLSVGIAIGHFMENLEDLLGYGRAAEKAAKEPSRDGLAVHLHKRGGAPIKMRRQWADDPDKKLTDYAELIKKEAIPTKLPYDLRKLAALYKGWPSGTEEESRAIADAIEKDILRIIRDKQPRSGRNSMPEIERVVKAIKSPSALQDFTHQLLIARQIATALKQAEEATP